MQIASLAQVGAPTAADMVNVVAPPAAAASLSAVNATVVQPSVTIDLSDAAKTALAAQASAAPAASVGGSGVPSIVLQAQQMAGIIADGSTASNADKATALAVLYKLRFSDPTAPSSEAWFAQSTQAQRDQINNAVDKSTFFKQAVSAASQFHADGMAVARAGQSSDPSQTAYARFNQLPADQQVLVWAGGASQFGTVEQYRAFLGRQAAGEAASSPSARVQSYGGNQTPAQGTVLSMIA